METNRAIDPAYVAGILQGAAFPWWIAGGWALDLFLDSQIRPRKDVDLAILRRHQSGLRTHLSDWDIRVAVGAGRLVPWLAQIRLDPPLHELWARPKGTERWVCEFLMNNASATEWIYRRDPRVTYPLEALLTSRSAGLPTLPPEIVLLYKSKSPRAGDELDFRATHPHLAAPAAAWLSGALNLVDPSHPWIREMAEARGKAGTSAEGPGFA
jgi:hypothetical protein